MSWQQHLWHYPRYNLPQRERRSRARAWSGNALGIYAENIIKKTAQCWNRRWGKIMDKRRNTPNPAQTACPQRIERSGQGAAGVTRPNEDFLLRWSFRRGCATHRDFLCCTPESAASQTRYIRVQWRPSTGRSRSDSKRNVSGHPRSWKIRHTQIPPHSKSQH